jgi:hypothetical protein
MRFISTIIFAVIQAGHFQTNASDSQPVFSGLDVVDLYRGNSVVGYNNYTSQLQDNVFWFSSADNKLLFETNPMYTPQAGGYCGWAMTGWDTAVCPQESATCDNCDWCVGGKCHDCTLCPPGGTLPTNAENISENCWVAGGVSLDIYDVFTDMRGNPHLFLFLGDGARQLFSGKYLNISTIPTVYTSNGTAFHTADYNASQFFATVAIDIWRENVNEYNTDKFD